MENDFNSTQPKQKRVFLAPLILLLGIAYIGFLLYEAVFVNYQTNKKIATLQSELKTNQSDKENLETLIAYYQTSTFQELEARKKLGLKMPGEKVVKLDVPVATKPIATNTPTTNPQANKSNIELWNEYLFD